MRADPLYLRDAARMLHLGELPVATVGSLAVTAVISIAQLAVTYACRTLLGAVWQPASSTGPRLLQPLWATLTSPPYEAYTASPLFPGMVSMLFYFVACSPWAVLDLLRVRRFKSQPDAPQRPDAWQHTLGLTAKHHLLLIFPGLYLSFRSRGPWLYHHAPPICWEQCDGMRLPSLAPRLDELLLHVAACFVIFDAAYGLWHWLHHRSPLLYKHIHSIHHEYHAPFAWVTQHEHALELLPVSLWSMTVPIGLGVHPLTQWVWLFAAIWASVEAHCGYQLGGGVLLHRLLPAWSGPRGHDDHHKLPRSNFQPFFNYFDRAFGQTYEQVSRREAEARGVARGKAAAEGGAEARREAKRE
jgi:cholesterol 25-hydroxylase